MGPKAASSSPTKLNGISVQSSLLGLPITIGWGRARIKCNLIWYNHFVATPHSSGGGGKGLGGGGGSNTSYTYSASVILALCQGPIQGVQTVYRDKSIFTSVGAAGLSLADGSLTQAPWSYVTSMFPDEARAYPGIAYVYGEGYQLNDSATLPNHSFEVNFSIQLAGLPDADPADIVEDILTNNQAGVPGWPNGLIGNWSDWSLYCRATNIVLSLALETQVRVSDQIQRIVDLSNSAIFSSEGLLKVRPYGDRASTANGVTWTPNLVPEYDLTEDDFEDLQVVIIDVSDAYNIAQVEYLDRSNQYNTAIATAPDDADISVRGERLGSPVSWHEICDGGIAQYAAQLLLQRTLHKRRQYSFTLPPDFLLLEQMDLVTVTTRTDDLLLDRQLVRILQIDEDESERLSMIAEHVDVGVASAAAFTSRSRGGYSPNFNAPPGDVAVPVIFNPPTSLQTSDGEVWCAVAGTTDLWGGCDVWISVDNDRYQRIGSVTSPARYGHLTASLPAHADPDTTSTLAIDVSVSGATIDSATTAEADALATLCLVDGELLAYRDATLTGAHRYSLTTLHRGVDGTVAGAHASGTSFVRLDDAIFKFSYPTNNVGATIYVKFLSRNIFGRAEQQLSDVSAYTIGVMPATALPDMVTGLALAGAGTTWSGSQLYVVCGTSARATTYRFDFYRSDGTTLLRSVTSAQPMATYTSDMAAIDGPQRTYVIDVVAINAAGSANPSSVITVSNTAPVTVTGLSATGGATTGTVTWDASTDADLFGYVLFFSGTSGFDPRTAGSVVASVGNTVNLYGLAAGTYYVRVAARDPWTDAPTLLNLTNEQSLTITTGGGSGTPSGGGGGGGYNGRGGGGTAIP